MYKFEDRPVDEQQPLKNLWEENQSKQLTSEGLIEIAYEISDPNMKNSYNPRAEKRSDTFYISDMPPEPFTSPLLDEIERPVKPYATLEEELWPLDKDKSRITVPAQHQLWEERNPDTACTVDCNPLECNSDKHSYSGYMSKAVCNSEGLFSTPPIIRIKFSECVGSNLAGLTVTWSKELNEYPKEYSIRSYIDGNTPRAFSSPIQNNSINPTLEIRHHMSDFNVIEIQIHKWSKPFKRVRASKIQIGINTAFVKRDLLNFSCSESIDPISASLPKYEISFEIDNRNKIFDPLSEESLSKYMMERQVITTRYGFKLNGKEEWIPGGVYYLSEWNAPQNGLSASFKARDLLGFMNAPYYGKIVETRNLYDLAEDVLGAAELPQDKDGNNMWVIHESLKNLTTSIPLPVCSLGECLQLIANAACCIIRFDRKGRLHIEPFAETNTDLEINDENSYSRPEINLSKPVKQIDVSVYKYVANENPQEEIVNISNPNVSFGETQTLKNVLIDSAEKAQVVGEWLIEHLNRRKHVTIDWRLDPQLDACDVVKVASSKNGVCTESGVCVTSNSFSFSGAFKGKSEGVMFE